MGVTYQHVCSSFRCRTETCEADWRLSSGSLVSTCTWDQLRVWVRSIYADLGLRRRVHVDLRSVHPRRRRLGYCALPMVDQCWTMLMPMENLGKLTLLKAFDLLSTTTSYHLALSC